MYLHHESPDGKTTDASTARLKISMESPNQPSNVSTKTKVSADYLRNLIDYKNLGKVRLNSWLASSRIKLITELFLL